ncbi:MAG: LLM class F420-dependent oxidoreductase, partial [Frankia sp.]
RIGSRPRLGGTVELGVQGLNTRVAMDARDTVRLARRAEQLGYRSWWASDHVVLPAPGGPGSAMEPTEPILDPLINLAYVAAVTERLELGTGIVILPQRNPLVLAKQAASLDVLSGGRLLLGVGTGWLEPELAALGVAMSERGARTDEYLDAMTALWTEKAPAYHGRFVDFENVDAHPRPVQAGGPRIIIGGHSPAAFRRAVRRGHGWFGNGSAKDLAGHLAGLEKATTQVDRPSRLGRLEITFMPLDPGDVDADTARRLIDLGVDRLLLFAMPLSTPTEVERFLERHADLPR